MTPQTLPASGIGRRRRVRRPGSPAAEIVTVVIAVLVAFPLY
jgi:hypothetical protein